MRAYLEKFKSIHLALILSAASGLIYEVVITNLLFFYFIESSYSISTVLSIFLFGLGAGSFVIYKFKDKITDKRSLFGLLQLAIAVYGLLVLANLTKIIPSINTFGLFVSSFLILLLPTLFLGAIFPLAASIIRKGRDDVTGLVYFIDLSGAVFGSLIAGFLLIPTFGNRFTILFAVFINLTAAAIIFRGWKKVLSIWVRGIQ